MFEQEPAPALHLHLGNLDAELHVLDGLLLFQIFSSFLFDRARSIFYIFDRFFLRLLLGILPY